MFMGQEIPFSAQAAGGVYNYKDGRTAPDTINVLLQYPGEYTATFEATPSRWRSHASHHIRMISNGTTAQNRYGMIASIVPRRPATAPDQSAAPCVRYMTVNVRRVPCSRADGS